MQRWRRPDATALVGEIAGRLIAGSALDDLPLDRVDGRLDLRGLPMPIARIPYGTWRDVTVHDVDLSHAWLNNASFHAVTFSNCKLDRADCSHASWWGCHIERCSFVRANLNNAVLGGDDGVTTWRDVSFVSADLRHAGGRHALFDSCRFDDARLTGARLTSALRNCHFSGRLRTLRIEGSENDGGRPLEDTDLTEADLTEANFVRVDLRLARLPPSGAGHIVVDDLVNRLENARRALSALGTPTATRAAISVDVALRDAAPGQRVGIVQLAGATPEERDLLRDVLTGRRP
jgi:uncharacterized protein YjbI with pentapeptide repeats